MNYNVAIYPAQICSPTWLKQKKFTFLRQLKSKKKKSAIEERVFFSLNVHDRSFKILVMKIFRLSEILFIDCILQVHAL